MGDEPQTYIGEVVGWVVPNGPYRGEVRPALVLRIWTPETVNLMAFPDSNTAGTSNDMLPSPMWATSSTFDPKKTNPGSWHHISIGLSAEMTSTDEAVLPIANSTGKDIGQ
jgi:hypothetical protein